MPQTRRCASRLGACVPASPGLARQHDPRRVQEHGVDDQTHSHRLSCPVSSVGMPPHARSAGAWGCDCARARQISKSALIGAHSVGIHDDPAPGAGRPAGAPGRVASDTRRRASDSKAAPYCLRADQRAQHVLSIPLPPAVPASCDGAPRRRPGTLPLTRSTACMPEPCASASVVPAIVPAMA